MSTARQLSVLLALLAGVYGCDVEERSWQEASAADDAASYQAFLDEYPGGKRAADAARRIYELDLSAVQSADTIAAYEGFLASHPDGSGNAPVLARLSELRFAAAVDAGTVEALEGYLRNYSDGPHTQEAWQVLGGLREQRAWDVAAQGESVASYATYLDEYPDGRFSVEARVSMADAEERPTGVVLLAQRRLNEAGYDAGAPDGRIGERTRDALRGVQMASNLDATGEFTTETLRALSFTDDELAAARRVPVNRGFDFDNCEDHRMLMKVNIFQALLNTSGPTDGSAGFVCCDGGPLDWWSSGDATIGECLGE